MEYVPSVPDSKCPNNNCQGWGPNSHGDYIHAYFVAFSDGTSGYYSLSGLSNGVHTFNGKLYDDKNYQLEMQVVFNDEIEAQRKAAAWAIVENSKGKISYDEAYASLKTEGGYLKGGNFNFQELNPSLDTCGNSGDRCSNGLHFSQGGTYVHLDTANPFTFPGGSLAHLFVDYLGGHLIWYVIPRHGG
jgi:hypothetical protein